MKSYRITNATSGVELGIYGGNNEDEAWNACAEDAGDPSAVKGEDIEVRELDDIDEQMERAAAAIGTEDPFAVVALATDRAGRKPPTTRTEALRKMVETYTPESAGAPLAEAEDLLRRAAACMPEGSEVERRAILLADDVSAMAEMAKPVEPLELDIVVTVEALERASEEFQGPPAEYLSRSRESGVPVALVRRKGHEPELILVGQEAPGEGSPIGERTARILEERS